MKRTIKYVLTLLLTSVLFGCVDQYDDWNRDNVKLSLTDHYLSCWSGEMEFSANGTSTQQVAIYTNGTTTNWKLAGVPDWLTASKTSGNMSETVTLSASKNNSPENTRVAVLSLTSSDMPGSYDINVTQQEGEPYANLSSSSLSFSGKAETQVVTIESNCDWSARSYNSWCIVEKKSATELVISVDENTNGMYRSSSVEIQYNSSKYYTRTIGYIDIRQDDPSVTGIDKVEFGRFGGSKEIEIESDATWNAKIDSYYSWLQVTPSSGSAGKNTLTIEATKNGSDYQRTGYVYVNIGSYEKLGISVSQLGINYELRSTEGEKITQLTFGPGNVTQNFSFYTNANWEITQCPTWLTLSQTSAEPTSEETYVIEATVEANPNTTQRSDKIVFYMPETGYTTTLWVYQDGVSFSDLISTLDFGYNASELNFDIYTNSAWTASANKEWIHLSADSGEGDAMVTVSVDDNNDGETRTGTITVSVGNSKKTITVTQKSKVLEATLLANLSDSKERTIEASITSTVDWTAETDVDWMTITPTSGSGDATLSIKVEDNASINRRKGTLKLLSDVMETRTFEIMQPGRSLKLNTSSITMYYNGGTSSPVIITTDGTYTVTTTDDWITIEEKDNTFTVTVTKNEGATKRNGKVVVNVTGLPEGESLTREVVIEQNPKTDDIEVEDWGDTEDWDF